jgi:hypothetical protein
VRGWKEVRGVESREAGERRGRGMRRGSGRRHLEKIYTLRISDLRLKSQRNMKQGNPN